MNAHDREWCTLMPVVAGSHPAKYHMFELCEEILEKKVEGDFAECGVMAGGQIAVMCKVLEKYGDTKRMVHAFDSFEGIPMAGDNDLELCRQTYGYHAPGTPLKTSGESASTVENMIRNLQKWGVDSGRVITYKGWFEETLAEYAKNIGPLALLRIDVDLYDSTVPVLEHLYPKVVSGGYIVDDDFGPMDQAPTPCRQALIKYLGGMPKDFVEVAGNPGTAWWRKP